MTTEREGVAERWVARIEAIRAELHQNCNSGGKNCEICATSDEALDAAIRALRQGGGWLPIESAPKDGSYILASDGDDTGCAVVNWDEGGWCYAWHRHDGPMQMHSATHWQPLPAPPSPAKEG